MTDCAIQVGFDTHDADDAERELLGANLVRDVEAMSLRNLGKPLDAVVDLSTAGNNITLNVSIAGVDAEGDEFDFLVARMTEDLTALLVRQFESIQDSDFTVTVGEAIP